jgi:2-phospho-L-lactate/phosphoenolpyruvate guanylyltransferase
LRATAIVPVKRFAAAKRRLAAGIPNERREMLVAAMLEDVLEAIGKARAVERTIVVSDEPRAAEIAKAAGAEVVPDPGGRVDSVAERASVADIAKGGDLQPAAPSDATTSTAGAPSRGHSNAALAGIARAEADGATCVVLLPGDCPLLEPRELDRLLTGVPGHYVAVVPDRHGTGTNALVLSPPSAIRPAFGEGSCARHVAAAREAGVPNAVEELASLALDLDTPADVVALTRELERHPGRAVRTAKALGI